jgi:fructosamine-3-kinase
VSLPAGAGEVRRIGGGDINEAFRVVLADGREAFVKTREDVSPGEYEAEAAGLQWLAEPGALRTPRVLVLDENYLALEWIDSGSLDEHGEQELGRGLAATHDAGAPGFGALGPPSSSTGVIARFGSLALGNEPTADWPSFYAERRLLPLARMARDRGALGYAGVEAVERVCERLGDLCGPSEPPARLHGDLWQGNVMADRDGHPLLIDPSAYGGHREIDLAMLALFGSAKRVIVAYHEHSPLAEGWQERVGLYQLLPLLVHAFLFGGSYSASAERTARRYAG